MPLIDNNNTNNNNNNSNHHSTSLIDDYDDYECIQVTLTRSPLHGFGIAISGGNNENKLIDYKRLHQSYPDENQCDQQSLIVCEVIKNGPADGKLLPNDEIINVNGHPVIRSMEYSALRLIRESTDFVNLVVRRRKHPVIVSDAQPPIKCILNKTRKDEKFGVVLGCRYFVKKIHGSNSEAFNNLQEGDEVIKINETPVDRLTLQEAQKLIDKAKERLILFVMPNQIRLEKSTSSSLPVENENLKHHHSHQDPSGNSIVVHNRPSSSRKDLQSDYNQHLFERSTIQRPDLMRNSSATRYVSFFTDTSSMGIRLAGGDKHGLFICEVQPNSVAFKAGLMVADKIFSVNNVDFTTLTREEAVLCLMNMKVSQVNMIVANLRHEYEQLLADVGGDSFYVRAHFSYNTTNEEELPIRVNDIFHVTDTLYNGQIGCWVATKLNVPSSASKVTGAIPNKIRAEQLASVAPSLDQLMKPKQPSFKRKLRSKFSEKRSRSVSSLNHLKEDTVFAKVLCWKPVNNSKFPAYERVILKGVTMVRPIVLFGPLADIARDRLIKEYPDRFEMPRVETQSPTKSRPNVIKLQTIKNVMQRNRHCLLDVTPTAVEQLNYAQCYPIVIYFKASDRRQIKQIRQEYGKLYQKSSRRLFDSSERLEYFYSYLFTSVIKLDSTSNWYKTLKAQIELQQEQPIWMSDDRPADKDLPNSDEYFISTRHSYSDDQVARDESSPDSDRVQVNQTKNKNYLQRVASDPVVFPKDKSHSFSNEVTRDFDDDEDREDPDDEEDDDNSGFLQHSSMSLPNRSHSVIEIPTISSEIRHRPSNTILNTHPLNNDSLLYQRSISQLRAIGDPNVEQVINGEASFHTGKLNNSESVENRRSFYSSINGPPAYRAESLSQMEREDLYRLQRLYQYDEQDKYQTRSNNESLSNAQFTAKLSSAPSMKTTMHHTNGVSMKPTNGITNRVSSRRPLIAPKLRAINISDRLSSSDSGGSIQHKIRKNSIDKSTMTHIEKNISMNGYATWSRPMSASSTRPTIIPSNGNDTDSLNNNMDPSYRIMRCTSMDAVRRNEQISRAYNKEDLSTDLILKPKVASNRKHHQISNNAPENIRSHSFSINGTINTVQMPPSTQRHHYQNADISIQKPRVYMQNESPFVSQQSLQPHHIVSSSSTSSSLSVKDKSIKEIHDGRSNSIQEGCNVIGGARGVMDYYGGKLSCPSTGVSISVPIGAIPEGVQQEIYFQVCQDGSNIPSFTAKQGERLLSPIVMCGPHGVQFLKPVELVLPHCAGSDAQQLALMLHGGNQNGLTNHQQDKSSILNGINHVTNSNVSILVDHF